MDGVEVTRRIRREVGNDVPIVMISAYDISEVEEEARAAGVNGFLPKPLYRSSVYAAIKDALKSKGQQSADGEEKPASKPLDGFCLLMAGRQCTQPGNRGDTAAHEQGPRWTAWRTDSRQWMPFLPQSPAVMTPS